MASSFPFRVIGIGDPVPSLTFEGVRDGAVVTVEKLKGNPLVLVFWGADIETKKERSLKTFAAMEEILPFLDDRKVKVLLVNAQGDSKDVIQSTVSELSGGLPVYTDATRKAYGELGIFVIPSVLLLDKEGKVSAGLGYSHDFKERLTGEVEIMLGEKTREEVESELRPEMKERTADEKKTVRHLNMALVMKKRGQVDSAIAELQSALAVDPEMAEAHGELGCLYLEKGNLEEAKKSLDKSYDLDPEYLPANICDARVMAEEGQVDEGLEELKILLFRNARNPELHYTVGILLEKKGMYAEAAGSYRKAFELVSHEVEMEN
ncbi:MAG: tetratricopeptide repeat protein [Desulfobulbaceae bacterium]|nr:tetratricopeptide repeat protein [Desulfobulbaceae bacterium]